MIIQKVVEVIKKHQKASNDFNFDLESSPHINLPSELIEALIRYYRHYEKNSVSKELNIELLDLQEDYTSKKKSSNTKNKEKKPTNKEEIKHLWSRLVSLEDEYRNRSMWKEMIIDTINSELYTPSKFKNNRLLEFKNNRLSKTIQQAAFKDNEENSMGNKLRKLLPTWILNWGSLAGLASFLIILLYMLAIW